MTFKFNKMMVMVPLMLACRKIDGDNADIVFAIRVAYCVVQVITILLSFCVYMKATADATNESKSKKIIYVPPPPTPFADTNAPTKYTETSLAQHTLSTARSMIGSTLFGIAMTVGLHVYKGIVMGLSMQVIMGPLGFIENPLVRKYLLGSKEKVFGEKSKEELKENDEVVDSDGNIIPRNMLGQDPASRQPIKLVTPERKKDFEEILLDTWDDGARANIEPLMKELTKENINYKTKKNEWTPIMILSGLGAKGVSDGLNVMKELGADPSLVDADGWNALHWAAFHGSAEGAKILFEKFDGLKVGLHSVKDKDGKVPFQLAKAEKNIGVADAILEAIGTIEQNTTITDENGLRRRKVQEDND